MERNQERTIKLQDLFKSALKYWYLILSTVIIGCVIAFVMAFYVVTPKYKSTAELLVTGRESTTGDHTPREAITYIPSIETLLKIDLVINEVIGSLDPSQTQITAGVVRQGISISSTQSNLLIRVSFTHTNPEVSELIANRIVDSAYELANTNEQLKVVFENTFLVVKKAEKGVYVSPSKTLYLLVGFLLGAMVGALIVFVLEFSRATYRGKEEVESDLKIQVMGIIPEYEVQ